MRSCWRRGPQQDNGPRSVRGRQSASPRIAGGLVVSHQRKCQLQLPSMRRQVCHGAANGLEDPARGAGKSVSGRRARSTMRHRLSRAVIWRTAWLLAVAALVMAAQQLGWPRVRHPLAVVAGPVGRAVWLAVTVGWPALLAVAISLLLGAHSRERPLRVAAGVRRSDRLRRARLGYRSGAVVDGHPVGDATVAVPTGTPGPSPRRRTPRRGLHVTSPTVGRTVPCSETPSSSTERAGTLRSAGIRGWAGDWPSGGTPSRYRTTPASTWSPLPRSCRRCWPT